MKRISNVFIILLNYLCSNLNNQLLTIVGDTYKAVDPQIWAANRTGKSQKETFSKPLGHQPFVIFFVRMVFKPY